MSDGQGVDSLKAWNDRIRVRDEGHRTDDEARGEEI